MFKSKFNLNFSNTYVAKTTYNRILGKYQNCKYMLYSTVRDLDYSTTVLIML